jgi:hypothetical protein
MSDTWDDPTATLSYNDGGLDSGYVDSGAAPFNDGSSGSGSGVNYQQVLKGLQQLQDSQGQQAQKPAVSNLPGTSGVAPGGIQAQSGAYSGNAGSMNALVQMLMQRVQALRDASNPAAARPVNLGGQSRPAGLLGL